MKIEHLQPRPCQYAQALAELLDEFSVSESAPTGHPHRAAPDNNIEQEYHLVLPGSVTTPALIRMLEPQKTYPYVVIRFLPACYGAFPIEFISDESQQPEHEDSWRLMISDPCENGELTPETRQAVLDITEVAFNRMRGHLEMYAIFAENDCVKFQLDGSKIQNNSEPSMTIDWGNDLGSTR
jgi:hypothetical protein